MFSGNKYLVLRSLIMLGADCILISAALHAVMLVRFGFDTGMLINYDPYLIKRIFMTGAYAMSLSYFELYAPSAYRLSRDVFKRLVQSIIVGSGILFVTYYFYPPLTMGRGVWVGNIVALLAALMAWRWAYQRWLCGELPRERILIVGSGPLAKKVAMKILDWKGLGMDIVGFLDKDDSRIGYSLVNPKIVGSYEDLEGVVRKANVNRIILALPDRRKALSMDTILKCKLRGVRVEDGESFFETVTGRIPLDQLRPSWMVFGKGFMIFRIEKMLKRAGDMVFAALAIVASLPIFLAVPLIIKLDSPGPVFFRQKRIGENGRLFTLVKFRTMRVPRTRLEAERWAQNDDERVTKAGRFLRKSRIDEIPQFLNVLKGDMSLVGPRPDVPYLRKELKDKIPYYSLRYMMKPGITGWAQIKYRYVSSVEEAVWRHEYDLFYIKNHSLFLDFWIMIKTVQVMIAKAGAR